MGDATGTSEHECRHCSGLCAGRAAKCPYCKKWLRREPAELTNGDRSNGAWLREAQAGSSS
ncbi:MAG: hypothetical protein U0Q22_15460 [Acidimicrobiales bacterium]